MFQKMITTYEPLNYLFCEHLLQQLELTFTPGNSCQGPEALLVIRCSLEKAHTSYIHSKEELKPEVRCETSEARFTLTWLQRVLSCNAFVPFCTC